MIGLVLISVIRNLLSNRAGFAAYCRTDFIIAPIWILCLCEMLTFAPFIIKFFGWFSKYSMYIWVCHLIFFDKFFNGITLATGYAAGNYLTLVLMVTIISLVLEFFEKGFFSIKNKIFNKTRRV